MTLSQEAKASESNMITPVLQRNRESNTALSNTHRINHTILYTIKLYTIIVVFFLSTLFRLRLYSSYAASSSCCHGQMNMHTHESLSLLVSRQAGLPQRWTGLQNIEKTM